MKPHCHGCSIILGRSALFVADATLVLGKLPLRHVIDARYSIAAPAISPPTLRWAPLFRDPSKGVSDSIRAPDMGSCVRFSTGLTS